MEPKNAEYFRPQIDKKLEVPLKTFAAAKNIPLKRLVSQILTNFVVAREGLLRGITQNGEVDR